MVVSYNDTGRLLEFRSYDDKQWFSPKSFANLAKLRQIYKTHKAEIMCRKELVSHMMFNSGKKTIGGMPNIRLEKKKQKTKLEKLFSGIVIHNL